MTEREITIDELLAAMCDLNLYRLRRIVEDRMLSQPDDERSANLHELIIAEECQRRDAALGRAA